MKDRKAVVVISGGMDSATLLLQVMKEGFSVYALSFDYGQRHKRELEYAKRFCVNLGVPHRIVELPITDLLGGSALTSDVEMPHGAFDADIMKQTVVSNRNMIMLSIAVGNALSFGAEAVYYGAHAGDHTIYPDCRPEFLDALNGAVKLCDWKQTEIRAPFLYWRKGDIVKLGILLGVDYANTWTCYEGKEKPCGKCGSCDERRDAFAFAGVPDPFLTQGG